MIGRTTLLIWHAVGPDQPAATGMLCSKLNTLRTEHAVAL